MLKVSDKIKLTVIAEDSAVVVDGGVAKHNSLLRTVSKFSHRCTHIVIQSSQCVSFHTVVSFAGLLSRFHN